MLEFSQPVDANPVWLLPGTNLADWDNSHHQYDPTHHRFSYLPSYIGHSRSSSFQDRIDRNRPVVVRLGQARNSRLESHRLQPGYLNKCGLVAVGHSFEVKAVEFAF